MGKSYAENDGKVKVDPSWTKYLLTTHPVEFITTIGRVNETLKTDIAPFATCLDTSYNPPYIQLSCAIRQHVAHGELPTMAKMNTYLNIRQNGLFIINVPPKELLLEDLQRKWPHGLLDIVGKPYPRKELKDKIFLAGLTKIEPFVLSGKFDVYPPLIKECLAHLECEVVDIHRPKKSDHYNITGEVVGASYDTILGKNIDEIRWNLAKRVWHHFGSRVFNPSERLIGYICPRELSTNLSFHLEHGTR